MEPTATAKRRRFRPQFSLRTLIVLTFIVAVAVTWAVIHERRYSAACDVVARISDEGTVVVQDYWSGKERTLAAGELPGRWEDIVEVQWEMDFPRLKDLKPIQSGQRKYIFFGIDGSPIYDFTKPQKSPEDIRRLGNLPRLTRLSIGDIDSGEEIEVVSQLQGLEYLALSGIEIKNNDLKHLAQLQNLKYLSFEGDGVTAAGLKHLAPLKELCILDISRAHLGDELGDVLRQFPKLTHLYLEFAGIEKLHLKPPLNLRFLQLGMEVQELSIATSCQVEAIDVSTTNITNANFAAWDAHCGLKRLAANNELTVEALAAHPLASQLEHLTVWTTSEETRHEWDSAIVNFPRLKSLVVLYPKHRLQVSAREILVKDQQRVIRDFDDVDDYWDSLDPTGP